MKRFDFKDLPPEDSLDSDIQGAFNSRMPRWSASWSPSSKRSRRTRAGGCPTSPRQAVPQILPRRRLEGAGESHDGRSTAIGLYRTKAPALDMTLWLGLRHQTARRGRREAAVLLRGGGALPQVRRDGARVGLALPGQRMPRR